ncbi:MAG: glycosyltransferase [Tannerella sp.]|jgi:1,2-diacylglycerol 3-alpha-glucosyltransferase|nr:glycosyltransferase [Tannerella sp.]
MNILVINPVLYSAENRIIPEVKTIKETMIYSMCLGFVSNGHRVTLAASAEFKPVEEEDYEIEVLFFKSQFVRLFPPALIPYSSGFYKFLKSDHHRFDMVLCSEVFTFPTLFASIICPSKTVIWQEMTVHQSIFRKMPSKFWHHVIIRLFIRKVRCVIPRSKRAYAFISRYMKNVSSTCVDHGINTLKFRFSEKKERYIITSSRLISGKNIESIIEIYGKLIRIKGYEDIRLLIAGRGELQESLEQLVAKLGLRGHVLFLGFLNQQDLNNAIKHSYVFLVNTLRDMNMVSIPESIASGTPVITNLLPASADYIAKEKLGVAKDHWNEYDIIEVIDNNSLYVCNCLNYREQLSNSYSTKKITDIFMEFSPNR